MSIAKATVTGTVYRAPEKRFTQNNIAVSAFVVNIGEKDEVLLRVISNLQTGQFCFRLIHSSKHFVWKVWQQGKAETFCSISKSDKHITHPGTSFNFLGFSLSIV